MSPEKLTSRASSIPNTSFLPLFFFYIFCFGRKEGRRGESPASLPGRPILPPWPFAPPRPSPRVITLAHLSLLSISPPRPSSIAASARPHLPPRARSPSPSSRSPHSSFLLRPRLASHGARSPTPGHPRRHTQRGAEPRAPSSADGERDHAGFS